MCCPTQEIRRDDEFSLETYHVMLATRTTAVMEENPTTEQSDVEMSSLPLEPITSDESEESDRSGSDADTLSISSNEDSDSSATSSESYGTPPSRINSSGSSHSEANLREAIHWEQRNRTTNDSATDFSDDEQNTVEYYAVDTDPETGLENMFFLHSEPEGRREIPELPFHIFGQHAVLSFEDEFVHPPGIYPQLAQVAFQQPPFQLPLPPQIQFQPQVPYQRRLPPFLDHIPYRQGPCPQFAQRSFPQPPQFPYHQLPPNPFTPLIPAPYFHQIPAQHCIAPGMLIPHFQSQFHPCFDGFGPIFPQTPFEQSLPLPDMRMIELLASPFVDYYTGTPLYYQNNVGDVSAWAPNNFNLFPDIGPPPAYPYPNSSEIFLGSQPGVEFFENPSLGVPRNDGIDSMDSTPTLTKSWSEMMEAEPSAQSENADVGIQNSPDIWKANELEETKSSPEQGAGGIPWMRKRATSEKCAYIVKVILHEMVDCGETFILDGEEMPYVSTHLDDTVIATLNLPQTNFAYYVPPNVPDTDFFGGQKYVWQIQFMEHFSRFFPDLWRIQALPDFFPRGAGWQDFIVTSKLRYCCRECLRPWTSMRGKIIFSFKLDRRFGIGTILMKICGQVCIQTKCVDNDFQTPACYPEEIQRTVWKLAEYIGFLYYCQPINPGFYSEPDRALRGGRPTSPHRKEHCQACQKRVCSKLPST